MKTYIFKLFHPDLEDFFRSIEICSNQTFEELHNVIKECVGFDKDEMAAFYICDEEWARQKEITLFDMTEENNPDMYIMNDSTIENFIETPSQKLMYFYDFLDLWTFYIELSRTSTSQEENKYPRCISKHGEIERDSSEQEDIKDEASDFNINYSEDLPFDDGDINDDYI